MPGISVVYLARVIKDGEGLDTIKERFITSLRTKAFAEARAMAEGTGGRVLQWMNGATEPNPWPEAWAQKPNGPDRRLTQVSASQFRKVYEHPQRTGAFRHAGHPRHAHSGDGRLGADDGCGSFRSDSHR